MTQFSYQLLLTIAMCFHSQEIANNALHRRVLGIRRAIDGSITKEPLQPAHEADHRFQEVNRGANNWDDKWNVGRCRRRRRRRRGLTS